MLISMSFTAAAASSTRPLALSLPSPSFLNLKQHRHHIAMCRMYVHLPNLQDSRMTIQLQHSKYAQDPGICIASDTSSPSPSPSADPAASSRFPAWDFGCSALSHNCKMCSYVYPLLDWVQASSTNGLYQVSIGWRLWKHQLPV